MFASHPSRKCGQAAWGAGGTPAAPRCHQRPRHHHHSALARPPAPGTTGHHLGWISPQNPARGIPTAAPRGEGSCGEAVSCLVLASGRSRAWGEPCQHRHGPGLEGFSFTQLLCFYQNGFSAVIAFFFFFFSGKTSFPIIFLWVSIEK